MSQRHELTAFQKGEIIALASEHSHAEIATRLGIPRSTITYFLQRVRNRGSVDNIHRPGRPRKTSKSADRLLIRNAEVDTHIPLQQLKNAINIDISTRTIQRRLMESGIRKWRAVERPLLRKEHAVKRLEWAKIHRNWTVNDWRRVCWSDECAVAKDSRQSKIWVFRHQNMREKYDPKNIQPRSRDGSLSQMIWACFIGNKLGPIVFFKGVVNQDIYQTMIKESLVPFIEALQADGYPISEFQQDNARSHTAKKTRELLDDVASKHNLRMMTWPPNSPDLNPIESLWSHLKRKLHENFSDTSTLKGSPDTIRTILTTRLNKVWWEIEEYVLETLIESMPERVNSVLEVRGWYTRF
jgi:transposase